MKKCVRPRAGLAVVAVVAALSLVGGCAEASTQSVRGTDTQVVAEVGSHKISLDEVDKRALAVEASSFGNMRLVQALYEARRQAIESLVADWLFEGEAKKQGLKVEELLQREVAAKNTPVEDAEIQAWYEKNRERVREAPLEQVREPIRQFLSQERHRALVLGLLDRLKKDVVVRVTLDPPRQGVTVSAGDPTSGPADAPVQIVEYSDFQCPFCGKATPVVAKIRDAYGDKIRLVFRDFPLDNHPNAFKAAEAAQCALAQGKFWEYHDVLFANQNRLEVDALKEHAGKIGLDASQFASCLDEGRFASAVKQDMSEGTTDGVTATPTFFINGRVVSGALPFEDLKAIIDEELEFKKAQ